MEILTYGCSVNQSDSEKIKGVLTRDGLWESDAVVVNTCTVKTPTENKIRKKLRQLESQGKKVVVAGCIPLADSRFADEFKKFSFIGTNTQDITEAVKSQLDGVRYVNIGGSERHHSLPVERKNPAVGIVQIAAGCLGKCSYCQTRLARGRLKSYPLKQVKNAVEYHVKEGAKEIWLTAQDTGAWGMEKGQDLTQLIDEVAGIEGEFMLRVGMMNPNHALMLGDGLIKSLLNEKVYSFAHVPIQSANDQVLADMGRTYTVEDYMAVATRLSEAGITLATDIIVGYPTEDEKAFDDTLEFVKKAKPDIVNITRFWPRPKTKAAGLKPLAGSETKRRSRIANKVFEEVGLEKNRKWIGWSGRCLCSKENPDGTATVRNSHYKPIVVECGRLGQTYDVKVKEATYYDLRGQIIQ